MKEESIGRLLALYQSNLYFFSEKFPAVFDILTRSIQPFPFECDENGSVNVIGEECSLAGLQEQELHLYKKKKPDLFLQLETDVSVLSENLMVHPVSQGCEIYETNIDTKYRGVLLKELKGKTRTGLSHDGVMPVAVAYAAGYGVFLKRLIEDLDCLHLVIASCDVQEFRRICFLVDFREIFHFFSSRGRCLSVVLKDSIDVLSDTVSDHLVYINPPGFLHFIPFFVAGELRSVEYDFYHKLLLSLRRTQYGWGFADDEILGFFQGMINIKNQGWVIKNPDERMAGGAVAIVGSGPSVMDHIGDLEKISHDAVVVSCGSALSILKKTGIRPDVHFESERTDLSVQVIEKSNCADWLTDVVLIGPYNMSPRYFSLSPDSIMLMKSDDVLEPYARARSALTASLLPTCVNGAVDFFLQLGVEKIYLFGVDFGFKESSLHHASASFYFDQSESEVLTSVQGAAEQDAGNSYKSVGVNGDIYTTPFFDYAAYNLVNKINGNPGTEVVNCSDGVRLQGTRSFAECTPASGKKRLLQYLKNCPRIDAGEILNADEITDSLQNIIDLVRDFFPEDQQELSIKAVLWNFYSFYEQLGKMPAAVCVQGGILHLAQIFYEGWLRVAGDRETENSWLKLFVTTLPEYVSEVIAEFQRCLTEASAGNV